MFWLSFVFNNLKLVQIKLKRVYEPAAKEDGFRILMDKLWPRGLAKEKAKVDLWLREVSPSDELRKAFHGGKMEWEEFRTNYLKELKDNQEPLEELRKKAEEGQLTLVYRAKTEEHNQAVVLGELLIK